MLAPIIMTEVKCQKCHCNKFLDNNTLVCEVCNTKEEQAPTRVL